MTDSSRRKFVTYLGAGAVAVPVSAVIGTLPSHAADMVDPASGQAVALQYIEVSEMEGKNCLTCTLYQGGEKSGMCPLFAGSEVAAEAWCSAYTPKA